VERRLLRRSARSRKIWLGGISFLHVVERACDVLHVPLDRLGPVLEVSNILLRKKPLISDQRGPGRRVCCESKGTGRRWGTVSEPLNSRIISSHCMVCFPKCAVLVCSPLTSFSSFFCAA